MKHKHSWHQLVGYARCWNCPAVRIDPGTYEHSGQALEAMDSMRGRLLLDRDAELRQEWTK